MLSNLDFEFEHNDMAFPSVFTHKLNGVLENVKSTIDVYEESTPSTSYTIGVSSAGTWKHRFYHVNGDVTVDIVLRSASVINTAADIILILNNETASAVTIKAESYHGTTGIINLYDADLFNGTGVSIPVGKALKLTFTFLNGENVAIEGKMSV